MPRNSETALPPGRRPLWLGLAAAACSAVFALTAIWHGDLNRAISTTGHQIFSTSAEFSTIIMSFAIFTVGWYGYKQRSDSRNLVIALTFFTVGLLDFAHVFSLPGMPDFLTANSFQKADTFFQLARLIAAAGLLSLAFINPRARPGWLKPGFLLAGATAFIVILFLLVGYGSVTIPSSLLGGTEFTTFDLEILVLVMELIAIMVLQWRQVFGPRSTTLLQLALIVAVFSELSFLLYPSEAEIYNVVGHLFKTVSYYFILRAFFVSSLQQPYWELKKTREDLEHSFSSIGAALASSLDLDRALSLIAVLASDMLDSSHALVMLQQRDEEFLVLKASRGVRNPLKEIPLKEDTLMSRVWQKRAPVWINDISREPPPFRPVIVPQMEGLHSVVAAPILRDSQMLGEIAVFSERTSAFGEPEASLLAAFARQAAVAIENTRLFEIEQDSRSRIETYAAQLAILHNISLQLNRETDTDRLLVMVLDGAMQLTLAGVGLMMLIEDGKTEIVSIKYADWYQQRCEMPADTENMHKQITQMLAKRPRASLRVSRLEEAETELELPLGHLDLRGLIVGTIRDTLGRVKGHFMLSDKAGGADFNVQDEEVISLLAAQSSVALISAENFGREHYVAETLQSSLLPSVPVRDDLDVGLLYRSASPFGKVGGDYYDLVELEDNRLAVVVGDVCGKGIEAATYTAMIKYMLRAYLGEGMLPGECLTRLNINIGSQIALEKFITLCLGIIDARTGIISYTSAGHPPPIICNAQQAGILPTPIAVPLGVLDRQTYTTSHATLEDACHIILYSDGLIEARSGEGPPFGEERVTQLAQTGCAEPAQKMADTLADAAVAYSGGNLRDDVVLLVVRLHRGKAC